MFKKNNNSNSNNEDTNFWISYADLMAGLLFVFILLIGAIIVKSTILKQDINKKDSVLNEQSQTLMEQSNNIDSMSQTLHIKDNEITKLQNLLAQREESLKNSEENLIISNNTLKLKSDEIENLNQLLLAQNSKIDKYSNHIVLLQNLTEEQNSSLTQKDFDLEAYKNKIVLLSNSMTKQDEKLKLNENKLLELLKAIDNKQTKYDELLERLQAQKSKIKSLTGIKLKVIAELKSSLGDKINIDKNNGSLRLASNILFDKGSSTLKDGAKSELKENFINYVNTLIMNKNIAEHLDKIIIEGHTDSDGSYLYNLNLSQQRAFAVMNYLLTLDYIKEHNIKEKLVASGRSYLDTINTNGVEDKDASRRIEVKFRLKNEDAMYEIERILDAD
jgi:chemotaxis protein MotB